MTLKGSFLKIAGLAATAFVLAAPTSQATQLEGPDFACPTIATEKPFKQFRDSREYRLVPGGGFEDGMPLWGPFDVKTVDGNEPFKVRDELDSRSALIEDDGTVTSKPLCVERNDRMRFFARASELTAGSRLAVDVIYEASPGQLRAARVANLRPSTTWRRTRRIPMFGRRIQLGRGVTPIELRFRTHGDAHWQIDDVYVDANDEDDVDPDALSD